MKFPALLLGCALVCCLGIAGYIHSRRRQEIHLNKQASFLDIKFRVTRDVLGEYQDQLTQSISLLDKTKKEVDGLTKEVSELKDLLAKKKNAVDTCKGDKTRITNEIAATRSESTSVQTEFVKEKSHWPDEVASLKKTLNERSKLCEHIDRTSEEGRKLCGITEEPPKPEEKPKEPEAVKPEPEAVKPKPEEPKPDQPKPVEPKPDQAKVEEPKPDQPKPEEPKPDQPKAEEPKPVDKKAEESKPEQPKPVETKAEETNAEKQKVVV